MRISSLVKMAAAAAAVLFCIAPLRADASELISSAEYGNAIYVDEEGVKGILLMESNDKTLQFSAGVTADPYFIRYNSLDASLAKLKASAVASIVMDENGNVVAVKDAAALQQDVAMHLANLAALDAMSPEQKLALEMEQLEQMNVQAQQITLLQQEMTAYLQVALTAGMTEEAEMAQECLNVSNQIAAVLVAKQQALWLYQQNAAPQIQQQALQTVQNYAVVMQQGLSSLLAKYQNTMASELAALA